MSTETTENSDTKEQPDEASIMADVKPGMLTDAQLEFIMICAGVTPLGKALVRQIRKSEPDTAPKSSREIGNTTGKFPSALMGLNLQFGSIFPELCALFYIDSRQMSPNVVEFWNRISIKGVDVLDVNGRRRGTVAHPVHALVIERRKLYFIEIAREADLDKNGLFTKQPDNSWRSPAIEAAVARYGVGYRLILDSELGKYMVGNLSYLCSCFYSDFEACDDEEVEAVAKFVREAGVCNRKKLIEHGFSARAIKQAIAEGKVYFPLAEADLTNTVIAFLYADREDYVAHKCERQAQGALTPPKLKRLPEQDQTFTWDGKPWRVANAGETDYCVRSDTGMLDVPISDVRRYCDAGTWIYEVPDEPGVMRVSARRRSEAFALLELRYRPHAEWLWPYGKRRGQQISDRSIARIKSAIVQAEITGRSPLEALMRSYDNCGCHAEHTDGEREVWAECLKVDYLNNRAPTVASVADTYRNRCKAKGYPPVSTETIRRRIRKLDKAIVVREQDGTFAAYQWGNFVPQDKANKLVKGRVPFEVCHVDHTPLSVSVRCCVTGKVSKVTVWRTVLRDACHFRVHAHVVHYGSPSFETLYRLLLELVKRTGGRLPQYIVCDRGLDFRSKQWEATIARFGVIKLNRPARRPRHGQPVESGNRKDDVETISNLEGHAKPNVDFRVLKGDFVPSASAIYTVSDIRRIFDEKYYEIEPRHPSSRTKSETILEFESRVLAQVDTSHIRRIGDYEEFRFLCMPEVQGTYRVVSWQGSVQARTLEYFSQELVHAEIVGSKVLVHYDPDNLGRVFVWAKKRWIECRSECYELLSQFTDLERVDYESYLKGDGQNKSVTRIMKGMELAKSLSAARETARGRMAQGRALENRGDTYDTVKQHQPGNADDAQLSEGDAPQDRTKGPQKTQAPVVSERELEEAMSIPDFPSYSDRT